VRSCDVRLEIYSFICTLNVWLKWVEELSFLFLLKGV
jgi:hypothetical protein